jgi:hypothetical protein
MGDGAMKDYATKMVMIPTDGPVWVSDILTNSMDSWALFQNVVGGLVEHVGLRLGDGNVSMYLNEEGKYLDKPVNKRATALFYESYPTTNDYIVGNVMLTAGYDDDINNDRGFTATQVQEILARFEGMQEGGQHE